MFGGRNDMWTAKSREAKQLLNELRAGPGPISLLQNDEDRARYNAVQRRKLSRFEALIEDLEDLVTDGSPTARELTERQDLLDMFRDEARRFQSSLSGNRVPTGDDGMHGGIGAWGAAAAGSAGVIVGEGIQKVNNGLQNVGEAFKKPEESRATRALNQDQLLDLQRKQMQSQDNTMESLEKLVSKLKATSGAIQEEVDLQARMVDDLDKDFTHTQDRMKKLRKQGFKLAGEKDEEKREKMDRKEVIEDMKKKLMEKEEKGVMDDCIIM